MRKKFNLLGIISLILALGIFVFSYILYHYALPGGGFTSVYQAEPAKPMVTWLFAIWGTQFLFASVMCPIIGRVFFKEK